MNDRNSWKLSDLPLQIDIESKNVLKSLPKAHAALAELKGIALSIPNQNILINTLSLQEAKDSSAIENIITTHDELYKSELNLKSLKRLETKEVRNYIEALKRGFALVSERKLLTCNMILEIQQMIEKNNAGFRKLPGTALKNATTGETVYTPPQAYDRIDSLMGNLERFINDSSLTDYDPIVKMAIIHFQFESIHPFYDSNGRTGRIINILYLILEGMLDLPILYLSSYIIKNKGDYYRLLQQVRDTNEWEEWLMYIIKGVEETSKETIDLILAVKEQMLEMKHKLRSNYKFYSQDLLNNLFKHPYTRVTFVVQDLKVSRITAAGYLNRLAEDRILEKRKIGTGNYYINSKLYELLVNR
ncbi:MAG: Fic family protein [Bacteroidota bacterium]